MKKFVLIMIGLLLSFASLNAASFEKKAHSRSAEVVISSEKPLAVGSNVLDFDIKLKSNDSGIKNVDVKVFMPAMPGMPAMESKSVAKKITDSKYEATVNMQMGGTWQIQIFVVPNEGKKIRIKSSVNL